MNIKELGKDLIGKGLPLLGNMLGGSLGQKGAEIVAGVLGCEPEPDTVADALYNNPDLYLQLQKYEMDHKEELERLQIQEAGMYLADRQSARSREIETTKATGQRDWFLYLLAGIFVIGFFVLMGILIFQPVNENTALTMVIGALVSGVSMVLSYFFGSSKGSNDKNIMIGKDK
jgi:hypothetical protein